jgi:hypothetical protein
MWRPIVEWTPWLSEARERSSIMPYVLVQHTVSDYARFKPLFDDDGRRRRLHGCKGGRLLCSVDNPHEYTALFEWDDVEKARGFAASFEQGEALEWAGMIGPSKATVLEEVEAVGA